MAQPLITFDGILSAIWEIRGSVVKSTAVKHKAYDRRRSA